MMSYTHKWFMGSGCAIIPWAVLLNADRHRTNYATIRVSLIICSCTAVSLTSPGVSSALPPSLVLSDHLRELTLVPLLADLCDSMVRVGRRCELDLAASCVEPSEKCPQT